MDYTPFGKGRTLNGQAITIETPIYEWDDTTVPGTMYIRYEDTMEEQFIERTTGTTYMYTYAPWADRASAEYKPFIVST
jgi:hypothetical protein